MSEAMRCPQCQAEIPAGAPEGLCPQCLLGAAMKLPTGNAEAGTAGFSPSASKFVPPTPEALQAALPQLEVLQLLGQGGMGAVYKARQTRLDRLVAVKILPPEVSRDPAFIERFTREARSLAKLNHPNIVGIYDFGESGGYCWFVMEYIDGVNLRQAIRSGELKPAEVLKIVPQICEALQFAHDEGIVHRDIKPENVLLDRKGRVKIADFGLAKLLGMTPHDVSLTGTQQVMGTMHYMAPEQLEGSRGVDHRADIYSLGVTFYEMLTGELPIGRFAAPSKKVQIDVRLDEVVLRSLEKEPEQRYQHASEIKAEMDSIARGPSAPTADASKFPPSATRAQRGYFIAAMILLILASLAAWKYRFNLVTLILLLWGFAFWLASKERGRTAPTSLGPRGSRTATAVPQSTGLPNGLRALQLFACVLGLIAGFVPNVSYDLPFWGMDCSSTDNGSISVAAVRPGSPPELAGLRSGDYVIGEYFELQRRLNGLKAGETQTFKVARLGHPWMQVEVTGAPPLLNGIWYADVGYPIAGVFFLCLGLLIFATASLVPVPLWRSMLSAAVGLGAAIGFFLALHGDTIFSSYVLWRSGSAPFPGSMATFQQGFLGIAAGVLLVMLAAVELRHGILNPGPGRRDRPKASEGEPPTASKPVCLQPSYLRTVVVPVLVMVGILAVLFGLLVAFMPEREPVSLAELFSGQFVETRTPERYFVAEGGGILVFLFFLLLNAVWILRVSSPRVRVGVLLSCVGLVVLLILAYVFLTGMVNLAGAVLALVGLFLGSGFLAVAAYAAWTIWREWWRSDSSFAMKTWRTGLLVASIACLVCLMSFRTYGGPNQTTAFRIGEPWPWMTFSTMSDDGFRLQFLSGSTVLLIVGWLSFWAYRQSFIERKAHERPPVSKPVHSGPSYLRTVVVPILVLGVVLAVAALIRVYAFPSSEGVQDLPQDHLGDPERLALVGVTLAAIAFFLLNGVWLYRLLPAGGFWRRAIHVVGWTIVCLAAGAFLSAPADNGGGYVDYALWPYRGSYEDTVSLRPRFLAPDPSDFRRLVITEVREIQALGRRRADARFTRHDFFVQLDRADGQSQQIQIDALGNRSFRYRQEGGTEVRGPLLDLPVALAWMNLGLNGKEVDKEQRAIRVDRQAQFLLDLIQSRANGDAGTIPGRLDTQARALLDSYRNQTAGAPFFEPTGSENASYEPDVPVLYVGVPVMLAIWGLGLWLLVRRR